MFKVLKAFAIALIVGAVFGLFASCNVKAAPYTVKGYLVSSSTSGDQRICVYRAAGGKYEKKVPITRVCAQVRTIDLQDED